MEPRGSLWSPGALKLFQLQPEILQGEEASRGGRDAGVWTAGGVSGCPGVKQTGHMPLL